MDLNQILFFAQIVASIALIVLIAVQQRGTALGSTFGGGGGGGESYSARRGIQKKIYYATIVIAALFLALGILNLLI